MNENDKTGEYTANYDFLSPTDDYMFKLLFGDEHGNEQLTDFLKSILKLSDDDYSEVTIVDPHLLREQKDDKLGVLDVRVRTKSGKLIDIEIQCKPSPELRERVVFYAAKMLAGQMKSGKNHGAIKRVISIIITDYPLIPENDKYHNRYTLYDPETGSEFTDILEIHSLELPKIPNTADGTELWWWAKFLSARDKEDMDMIAQQNQQVGKAVVRYMELSADERTRMIIESRQKMEWDNRARERATVKKMINDNLPIPKIIEYTGLTREEIEYLQ